ncbi:MAG TPA: SRPBCC family protein [Flavisolibacter sp.]|nr:SRPBCC family protein [Flavisolibacter sp.]
MRIIKLAFISFFIIFLIVTAISLMIPSHIRLSRAVNLMADREKVFTLIRDQRQWPAWHPGFMKKDSPQRPLGLVITPVSETDSEIIMQLVQDRKKPVISGWKWYTHAPGDSLTLQWYMDFRLSWYPWQKFSSLFYENIYGTMMEQGLANLKQQTSN